MDGLPFFLMEFVDGLNLRQLERAGKLSPREALQIVPQICEALQFAHDEGIVHRDIKPENILLDKKGRVKIADFGIAKIMGSEAEPGITETSGAIGTPHYMAPEQVEKPETVDHRADIFSLGVVFYEMLTGELPLGKFAPPSRTVNVDVRLDDVVLRALEKEPDRRYQHVSQVRTAVDTIADGTAQLPAGDAGALAQEILARDYVLDIGSCLRRGWALVRSDFWPIVGISALMLLLVQATNSTAVGIVAGGPLMGGLWLYMLKRARGEEAGVDTGFSGFRIAFVDLFLAGLVTFVLTVLGFICLVLPGLYLIVAWMFALILVIDQRLRFWPAMELSRKVVTKHWLKFFAFWIVLLLMNLVGLFLCGIGIFFTAPIALAATVFAYEDIFGGARRKAQEALAQVGPSGTAVSPGSTSHYRGGRAWKPVAVGLAAVICLLFLVMFVRAGKARSRAEYQAWRAQQQVARALEASRLPVLGPVVERVFEFTNAGHRALNLTSGDFVISTPDHPLDFSPSGVSSLREAGVDLYLSDDSLAAFNNQTGTDKDNPAQLNALSFRTLEELVSNDGGEPVHDVSDAEYGVADPVSEQLAVSDQLDQPLFGNKVLKIVTRNGARGLLQIDGFTDDPPGVKVRYKLLGSKRISRESLTDRLEAAGAISNTEERSRVFAKLATDAAKIGVVDLVTTSLPRITDITARDQASLDSARILARGQHKRQAIEIAKRISDIGMRDLALSELAQ